MSQAKVDRNKEQKRTVKKIMAQERRSWMLTQAVLYAIIAAVVIWIAVALYQAVKAPSATDTSSAQSVSYTVDTSALDDYIAGLENV